MPNEVNLIEGATGSGSPVSPRQASILAQFRFAIVSESSLNRGLSPTGVTLFTASFAKLLCL
jgi:hypothetical protein